MSPLSLHSDTILTTFTRDAYSPSHVGFGGGGVSNGYGGVPLVRASGRGFVRYVGGCAGTCTVKRVGKTQSVRPLKIVKMTMKRGKSTKR
jgi:hypothetical protein